MKTLIALLKRELLEHKNLWRIPVILIGIALLVKLSLSVGNLAVTIDLPEHLQLDRTIDSALDTVIANALNVMNTVIMWVMFATAIFYALACLYTERQDQSVLFWRSLPISDSLTVASKLITALVLIPLVVVITQAVVAMIFFGTQSFEYLAVYYGDSLLSMMMVILWSLLPLITWCMFCSEVAKKNPFLLAFIAPILVIVVDKLFLDGLLSQTFIINRLSHFSNFTLMPLIWGILFSAICIVLTIIKRSQQL